MADKASNDSELVIQLQDPVTKESRFLKVSPQMVEALNSSDPMKRHHAYELISHTWTTNVADFSEQVDSQPDHDENCDNMEEGNTGTGTTCITSDESEKSTSWSKAATLLLINEMKTRKEQMDKGFTTKKRVFQDIAKVMVAHSHMYNADQIAGRWKTLQRGYKHIKDQNTTSGSGKKKYEYESQLDEYFGKDPIVSPVMTLSSHIETGSVCGSTLDDSEDNGEDPVPARKKRKSASGEMVGVMKSYIEAQEEHRKEEVSRKERMHQEKLALLSRLIDTVSKNK
ncbi:uncharacterized protein LOC127860959 isoform X2 [Dreissena polymorpha]|nr:uncharacterized protein LOC127860959 isoform X2 [Dreissena polymorpha]